METSPLDSHPLNEWVRVEKSPESAEEGANSGDGENDLLKVEFFEPATTWTDALPLGNGRLGAMVFGGVPLDLVMLNDDTLYSGGPKDWNNPSARELLPEVRQAVFEGRYDQATALAGQMLGPFCQLYQPLGTLELQFEDTHQNFDPDSYHRQLDLDTATVSVKYSVDDVTYTRDYFTSQPHQVLAVKLSADKARSVSFAVTLSTPLQEGPAVTTGNNILVLGRAPGDVVDDTVTGLGMAFAVALEVRTGGEDGVVEAVGSQSLSVKNVDWAVLVLSSSTSFDGPFKNPVLTGKKPSEQALAALNRTEGLAFEALLMSHLNDYQPLFQGLTLRLAKSKEDMVRRTEGVENRVDVAYARRSLGRNVAEHSGPEQTGCHVGQKLESNSPFRQVEEAIRGRKGSDGGEVRISTRDRVEMFKENKDPRMVTLLFQFGRYLLLASSRPGTFVANLQGIWNKDLNPAWRCVPHININLPMNYWPAETCNLVGCHGPLFDTIDTMAINGRITAQINYGLEGWVGHHNVDIWGQTAPVGGDPVWALWPMGGAWLCLHMWEHYCFSLNEAFLRNRAYPILKECAQFLLGWLVEDGEGTLITNPSTSPEHYFVCPDTGEWDSVTYASAMDLAIIRELFESLIKADRILGDLDMEFTRKLQNALDRLSPVKLAHDGCLLEWGREFEDPEEQHRHMSHLFGLFPGHSITPVTSPELCQAATKSMLKRGEVGPGWSMAWKTALWARLWNAEHAYRMVIRMFTLMGPDETTERLDGGGLYANLFNAHPPFQIDGNFGFTGAVAEMFLQSDGESLYLLPALPEKAWPFGAVKGLRGRGSATVSVTWEEGILMQVDIEVEVKTHALRNLYYQGNRVDISKISPTHVHTYDKHLKLQQTRVKVKGPLRSDRSRCTVI